MKTVGIKAIHKVFSQVEEALRIPVLHIVDPTATALREKGITKVGLLGTKVTMEEPFYKNRLEDRYGIETLVPEKGKRELVHNIFLMS